MTRLNYIRGPLIAGGMLLLTALYLLQPVQATQMTKQNLAMLLRDSQSILIGTVTKVTDGYSDNGAPYTQVTIQIGESLKGATGKDGTYTFRQFGLLKARKTPSGHIRLAIRPEGFPIWRENEQVMAFLRHPARLTGFQTTAGLGFGKLTLADGKAQNQFFNAGMFDDISVNRSLLSADESSMLETRGAVDIGTFVGLVRKAVEQKWVETGEIE